jgi:phosphatidylglycerophosphate synthase
VGANAVSMSGLVFAMAGAGALMATAWTTGGIRAGLFVVGAVGIQLRLLCNLLDGLVAVECGLKTRTGEIFNELPDRVEDWMILMAAGVASGWSEGGERLGWAASCVAVMTAYVRAMGVAAGARAHFEGPMAKPHRMALVSGAAVLSAVFGWSESDWPWMRWALWGVILGGTLTLVRRVVGVARDLEAR